MATLNSLDTDGILNVMHKHLISEFKSKLKSKLDSVVDRCVEEAIEDVSNKLDIDLKRNSDYLKMLDTISVEWVVKHETF